MAGHCRANSGHRVVAQFLSNRLLRKYQVSVSFFLFCCRQKFWFREPLIVNSLGFSAKRSCGPQRRRSGSAASEPGLILPAVTHRSGSRHRLPKRIVRKARVPSGGYLFRRRTLERKSSLAAMEPGELFPGQPACSLVSSHVPWSARPGRDRPAGLRCTASGPRRSRRRPTARPSSVQSTPAAR